MSRNGPTDLRKPTVQPCLSVGLRIIELSLSIQARREKGMDQFMSLRKDYFVESRTSSGINWLHRIKGAIMMLSRCIPLVFATGLGMAQSAYSQQVQIIEEINPGEFVDISQIGTPLGLGHDDVVDAGPFSGNFLLLPGRMLIGVNGGVGFGFDSPDTNGVELSGHNSSIPSNAFQGHQALLPYWDDLGDEIDDKNGDVYMARLAEPGRTMTIVQWDNLPLRKNPEDTVTFQVKIFDNQNPTGVYAQFIYADVEQPGASGGIGATIGYQDGSANFSDLQQSFDTAGAVSNGTVLSIVIEHRLGLESQAIPTVSEWGLIIMALLLLTGGTLIFCRGARRAHAFP
ncbi:MAG: IPTL-CTERM sorting domain-containing protein [Phycisphaerales bacterium]|nr:IPTL-CTERM sorting domain-containing protein [Phycisphaerales bacterium]